MTRAVLSVVAGLLCFATSAAAESRSLRLGAMELVYDAARWRAQVSALSDVTMHPIGEIARDLDPVRVSEVPADGIAACERLARTALTSDIYEDANAEPVQVSGTEAVRLEAWAKCRNAMPRAVALCAVHGGRGFLFVVREYSCQTSANNLFSRLDPLQELADGVRFLP